MERNPLNETIPQEASSPPRWRLSWDSRGLVLEERESDLAFAERASSAISFPPTPLAATHPELGKMVERTLNQFIDGWLHEIERIALAFSPPWGNAWRIPVGKLSGDDVCEFIEWELQQRLKDPLESNIYAWSRVNDDAYAVVIRPELLSFWEDLLKDRGITVSSVTLTSGLVNPKVEQEADLLPLLHLWQDNSVASARGDGIKEEVDDHPDIVAEDVVEDDIEDSVSEETEFFNGLHDDRRKLNIPLIWILPATVVLLLVVAGWLFRGPIAGLFSSGAPDETVLAEGGEEAEPVSGEIDSETLVAGSIDVIVPGAIGSTLEFLFATASTNGVQLTAVVLQGSELLVEASGMEGDLDGWRNALSANIPGTISILRSREASFGLFSFSLPESGETELSVMQFDQWVVDLGMTAQGQQVYNATGAMVDALIVKIKDTGARPWRLSVHQDGSNSYHVMMLP